jgi:hypothetical protein
MRDTAIINQDIHYSSLCQMMISRTEGKWALCVGATRFVLSALCLHAHLPSFSLQDMPLRHVAVYRQMSPLPADATKESGTCQSLEADLPRSRVRRRKRVQP